MPVTALNDQWQAARKLRYDEVMHRRSQINDDLQRWQTDRLAHTVRLRQYLNQMYVDLQDETDLWLTQTAQQRKKTGQTGAAIFAGLCSATASRKSGHAGRFRSRSTG
jgi:hypothetical protein